MSTKPLKFGEKYNILRSGLIYERTYLAKLESAQGTYHCFAGVTGREHDMPVTHDGKIVKGEYNRFPDLVIVESIKNEDFRVKGLEVIVKPKAKTILASFEHFSAGGKVSLRPQDANAEMCLRLMNILDKK